MRGKRILLVSMYDYAGSGYQLSEAVNLTTTHHVEYVVLCPYPYPQGTKRYPSFLKQGPKPDEYVIVGQDDHDRLQAIVDDIDIIHYKGDELIDLSTMFQLRYPKDVKIIRTVSGTFFRRGDSAVAKPQYAIKEYLDASDYRTAMTPDLNYPALKGRWVPQSYDSITTKIREADGVTIAHSPSDVSKKGTRMLEQVVKRLHANRIDVQLDLIQDVSYSESVRRKQQATLFFDQNIAGWYGNSAIEAMAAGVPVLAYLSEDAQAWSKLRKCPVINTGTTEDGLYEAVESALSQNIDVVSEQTKIYCDRVHSYEATGQVWDLIYRKVSHGDSHIRPASTK